MSTAATTAAIAAAAAKAAKDRDEEENLTTYKSDDLDGWEFKIVRSGIGKFKNPENIRKLCAEEAKAGWEMVEKFDNNRIRFKRPIEKRSQDQYLDFDPYRTSGDHFNPRIAAFIVGLLALLGGLVALFAIGFDVEITDPNRAWILFTLVGIGAVSVILAVRGKRRGSR